MQTFSKSALFACLCLVPLACSPTSDGQAALVISEQNAPAVAAQGLGAADFLTQAGELANSFTPILGGGAQTIPCSSGTMNVVVNDVSPAGVLSTGDSATITFNACVFQFENESITLTGSITLSADEITGGEEPPYAYRFTVTYSSLTMAGFGATVVISGSFTLEAASDDGVTTTYVLSGLRLGGSAQAGNAAFSGTITNFRQEYTINTLTGAYTASLDATVTASTLGGWVTYETTDPFTGIDPNDPDTGTMVVTGANGGTVTLIALDNVNVEIRVDVDGDGTPEATILTTWDQLDNG